MIVLFPDKTFTELNDFELATVLREETTMVLASDSFTNGKRFKISRYERYGSGPHDMDISFKAYTHSLELAKQVAELVANSPLPPWQG